MPILIPGRAPHGRVDRNEREVAGMTAQLVAPLTGAWIETRIRAHLDVADGVAPLTGAWIETPFP